MIKGKITLPELQTKKLWAGIYGGHYDVIVFFKAKPEVSKEVHNHIDGGKWYDCFDNKDLIVGSMALDDFYTLFPDADISEYTQENGRPMAIEIPEVFEIELTSVFDEHGDMEQFNFDLDGWVK